MQGELRVLNSSGDTPVRWDTDVTEGPLAPDFAKAEFERLVKEGHLAFVETSTPTKRKAEQIKKFDATQEKIILSPAFVGG